MHITYPRQIEPDAIFTQQTLDRLTSSLFAWQQGPGQWGGLHLHACWGETSVLTRRYQGQTTYLTYLLMQAAIRLYETTHAPRWQRMARDLVANILYLQAANGGFIHAASEAEPAYVPEVTCPIHQFLPIHALLDYAEWKSGDSSIQSEIRESIDRHWTWSLGFLWKSGNARLRPLDFPGWCGVTNQDLVAIASLARYAQVFGDSQRFEEFGRPSLDVYLSSRYWHRQIGLMERGDNDNFVERTPYYDWILVMLDLIWRFTGDPVVRQAIDNLSLHLMDALFIHDDGHLHLAWGAKTYSNDKSSVAEWIRSPITFSAYPAMLRLMRDFGEQRHDAKWNDAVARLERTLATYVFADGMIPGALAAKDPVFSIVTSPASGAIAFWLFLIERLGPKVRDPRAVSIPIIQRRRGELCWSSSEHLWRIERSGQRLFAGLKSNPGAIAVGPDETIAGLDLQQLDASDVVEDVRF